MKTQRIGFGLTLFVLLARGSVAGSASPTDPEPGFHFVLSDETRQLRGRSEHVARQVVDTFREMQIETTWSTDRNDSRLDPSRSVIVVVVPDSSRDWKLGPGVLGAASRARLRSVYIFYPDIERALDLRPLSEPTILGSGWPIGRWQRAIARVIAHEIVHYFLPDRPHDASGLFMADLSGSRLARPRFDVTEETRIAFTEVLTSLDPP
jgi:hypothetical protein